MLPLSGPRPGGLPCLSKSTYAMPFGDPKDLRQTWSRVILTNLMHVLNAPFFATDICEAPSQPSTEHPSSAWQRLGSTRCPTP